MYILLICRILQQYGKGNFVYFKVFADEFYNGICNGLNIAHQQTNIMTRL